MTQKPDAIFFDWDGTLNDSLQFLEDAHNAVKVQLGHERFEQGGFAPYFGKQRDYIYETIYGDQKAEARKLFEQYVFSNNIAGLTSLQGSEDVVNYLADTNIVTGVISNKIRPFIVREIDHFGWSHVFKYVIGAGDSPADKPQADPLLKAMADHNISCADNVWMVGDTESDILCAKNAGAVSILIGTAIDADELNLRLAPDYFFENLHEFRDFLLQLP